MSITLYNAIRHTQFIVLQQCGVFVCRYLKELVNGYYFAFDTATSHNRKWLAQFMLDEAMNQTPSVEIISEEPTGLNSTSGVTYMGWRHRFADDCQRIHLEWKQSNFCTEHTRKSYTKNSESKIKMTEND